MKPYRCLILFTILLFIVMSCEFGGNKGVGIEIQNSSDFVLRNIKVYTVDKKAVRRYSDILPNKKEKEFLDMGNVNKSDGAYILNLVRNNEILEYNGGYYTNGAPINEKIIFIVKNDTVLMEAK